MTWTDFWPLDLIFTTGHGWWLDPLRTSVGQGAEYWPPGAIRDLICPLRWLSLVNLTFLYHLCHTELFLLIMNYRTVRIYSLLPSERRRVSCTLNLFATVIVPILLLLGLLLTSPLAGPPSKLPVTQIVRSTPSSWNWKVNFGVKKSRALDSILSHKYHQTPFLKE